jgi:hypothetical protein
MKKRSVIAIVALLAGLLILAACATQTPMATPTIKEVEITREVQVTVIVPATPEVVVPFEEQWAASAHADKSAEAFVHWNEADPAAVPASCAKCHSETGYLDYIGADGSAANKVDAESVPVGTVVSCQTCHNDTTRQMTSVLFPSGVELTGLGPEARCMQCHQGRASKVQVDAAIAKAAPPDEDTPVKELGFLNIHYFAAAVSQFGDQVQGGYQYDGQAYDVKTDHVPGFNTCVGCHNSHTLEVKVDQCAACHTGVAAVDDLKNIRMASSLQDYDGDGDISQGIFYELEGVRAKLYTAIQAYAKEVAKTPIVYDAASHPYFFKDTNGDGKTDADEVNGDNRYDAWTARLEKAAFNYQASLKDPGAFAHGGKYIIQLMYDSIADLNSKLATPIDMSAMRRDDAGHFAGSTEAFRHWDDDENTGGLVPAACAKCHSGTGLQTFRFLNQQTTTAVAPANGFLCQNCHDDLATFTRYQVQAVRFPSTKTVTFGENNDANLCINCHQGRESKASLDRVLAGVQPDEKNEKLRFLNVHYFAAGATLFGTTAQGAYEYENQKYVGQNLHVEGFNTCINCHDAHALSVNVDECTSCHPTVKAAEDLKTLRHPDDTTDWNGNGDVKEGIYAEIKVLDDALLEAMKSYAKDKVGTPIQYNPARYPYFYADPNENGQIDEGEKAFTNWTPRLLKAAYNYQFIAKDPGSFAHNPMYSLQILYDGLKDLQAGGAKFTLDLSQVKRPAVPSP